jgi:type 1 glutamine amidotransferase
MKNLINRIFLVLAVVCISTTAVQAQGRRESIKALIVTGQNNHNWKVSHIALQRILEFSGRFTVDLAITPHAGGDMSVFKPDFSKYGVVVIDYNGDAWPDETRAAFLAYVKGGGGIVVYHAGNNAFADWKEFNEITGLGGWGDRNEKSGPYVYWENGKLVKDTSPGPGGSHGAAHEFTLNQRSASHPITQGLPEHWRHAKDELYDRLRGPGNINALYTAFSEKSTGGSGREEPLLFTVNYGKARIFATALGHAGPTLEDNTAMQCAGFQITLLRGCEWAATGKVTQPVPEDFPTEDKISLRPTYRFYPKPMDMRPEMTEIWLPQPAVVTPGEPTASAFMTPPSDAIVLFDGSDLSKWEKPGGDPPGWDVNDGIVTVVAPAGDIQTRDEFRDFQLHIEWRAPEQIVSRGQGRGNSGVFLQGLYEVQVLDNYDNETYRNGSAGSVYKQSAPLVNPIRKPGQWNAYDIIFTAPTFTKDGNYRTPPTVTVLFNGVLVQNNLAILGTTEYIGLPRVVQKEKGPIILQTHGNPVSYRNIWIREL